MKRGDVYKIRSGGEITILENDGWDKVLIRHNDEHGHEAVVERSRIRKGSIKNPYEPFVVGVGYHGVGEFSARDGDRHMGVYNTWKNMIIRGYCPKYKSKMPTYDDCTVDERWHNYQTFAKWHSEQYSEDGWQLDKDLLIKGNKIYSPEVCRMVPAEINTLFKENLPRGTDLPVGISYHGAGYRAMVGNGTGKRLRCPTRRDLHEAMMDYRTGKIEYVQEIANKWMDKICPLVYNVLMEYEPYPDN